MVETERKWLCEKVIRYIGSTNYDLYPYLVRRIL